MDVDLERVATAALDAFLHGDEPARDGRPAPPRRRRLRGARSLVAGVAVGIAARSLYGRARRLDLERVARGLEAKLTS